MKRIAFILLFLPCLVNAQVAWRLAIGSDNSRPSASVSVGETSGTYQATYVYSGIAQELQVPELFGLSITGTFNVNTELAVSRTFVQKNGYAESGSIINWYEATDSVGTGNTLVHTGSTYTPDEAGKWVQVRYTPALADGTTGVTVSTPYAQVMESFNWDDISWLTSLKPEGGTDIATNTYWANTGSLTDASQNGATALPTWDGTQTALRFTRANSQSLVLPLASPASSRPLEFWIRFRLNAINVHQEVIRFASTLGLLVTNGGGMRMSTSSGSEATVSANTWYVMRCVLTPTASQGTLQINNGLIVTVGGASGSGIAASGGRLGCTYNGTANAMDGWISHVFVKQGETTAPEQLNMWNKFAEL